MSAESTSINEAEALSAMLRAHGEAIGARWVRMLSSAMPTVPSTARWGAVVRARLLQAIADALPRARSSSRNAAELEGAIGAQSIAAASTLLRRAVLEEALSRKLPVSLLLSLRLEDLVSEAVLREAAQERHAPLAPAASASAPAGGSMSIGGLAFLSKASVLLASSLEFGSLLQAVADLTVPEFADGCAVHLVDNEGRIELAAFSHSGERAEAIRATMAGAGPLVGRAIHETVTDVVLDTETTANGPKGEIRSPILASAKLLHRLGATSFMATPLTVHNRTIGALSLVTTGNRSKFQPSDVELAEELARRVAVALDNARLFELAQRERIRVDEANRLKDEFLAMVSHELRSPLNAMLGWTTILRTGNVDDSQTARALETIERNARVQAQLIEDLLDITRITTGKLRLSVAPVDLEAAVHAAVETMQPAAQAKGIRIDVRSAKEHGPVFGDSERIQQIVWNLVSNAVKFSRNGGQVTVDLRAGANDVRVSVSDTGQGIAPEFLPHVFERFRQGEGGTTRSKGGLGLGLAIVKHLTELHGGTIEAESDGSGKGATFLVTLPIHHRPPETASATARPFVEQTPRTREPNAPPGLAGLRVLVVDDEADARDLVRALLEKVGMSVDTAGSAEEAMQRLEASAPQVIISDIGMPGEDGYVFMQRLRRLPDECGGRTPSIALTAYARMEDRSKALLAGYNMHVSKPIEPAELLSVLATVAPAGGGAAAARAPATPSPATPRNRPAKDGRG